ncbi:MAG: hypothetical protein ACE37B_11100 [Ilumatobacter sp.]|uniref:hypothetical protein n=1 Tax=Ilumatobacter sp. TaxID=1967498 RepID=UPI00391BE239
MSGSKVVGIALVAVMLGVWAVRSFVIGGEDAATEATVTTTGATSDQSDQASSAGDSPAPQPVVAAGDLAGIPVGYPSTDDGAATAAVNWVASFPTIVRMGPIRLDDTLNTLLSESRAASGSDEVIADYFTLIDELGPDFASRIWIESPLQFDVTETAGATASVAVWSMLVTGDAEDGDVEAIWRTHRISLVWERNDWRIDDITINEGPTPAPNALSLPSPSSEFVTVDEWQPAVFAGTISRIDD